MFYIIKYNYRYRGKRKEERIMAKIENAKTILANTTGKVVFILPFTTAGTFQVGVRILKDTPDGKNVTQSLTAYRNAAMSRGISNVTNFLERVCRYKDLFGRYVIDEAFVGEFMDRLNSANEEVAIEAQEFVDNYDEKRQELEDTILEICVANKRKRSAKSIIGNAMRHFPTKWQILSGQIYYTMDTDGTEAYNELSQSTKDLVDASRLYQAEYNRCQHVASRCNPVLENLLKFTDQVRCAGKLHGSTVTSYIKSVEELRIANETEFVTPLADLTDFLNIAGRVLDNPEAYVDCLVMGFFRFYATQGMTDNIPYEHTTAHGYPREVVEDVGGDPNNSFSLLAATVSSEQVAFTASTDEAAMSIGA